MEERDGYKAESTLLQSKIIVLENQIEIQLAELYSIQELLVEEQRDVALLEERYMEMLVIDKENLVLQQDVIDLESQIADLETEKSIHEQKIKDYEATQAASVHILSIYESQVISLREELEEVQQRYDNLLNSLNMTVVEGYSQTIEYNISAETDRTWEFLIPEYDVIWEFRMSFDGRQVKEYNTWRRGGEQYFLASSSHYLIIKDVEGFVYYGPREYLWGTINLEYYLDERHSNIIWVIVTMRSQLPTIGGIWDGQVTDPSGAHTHWPSD